MVDSVEGAVIVGRAIAGTILFADDDFASAAPHPNP
jgi:hypothetical protein